MGYFLASTVGPGLSSLVIGLALSFAVITLMRPVVPAPWRWAWQGVTLHVGLWLILYALMVLVLGRPWFAMAVGLAFLMLLVQVNNAKYHSLREVFVFQDFEYFIDAIRHPRLYIPFLGWWKFAMIVVAVLAALFIGLGLEAAPEGRFSLNGQLGDVLRINAAGFVLIAISRKFPEVSFLPGDDLHRVGFLGCLWIYGCAERQPMKLDDRLSGFLGKPSALPDFLIVQSESFFDPRALYSGVSKDVLKAFDQLTADAIAYGPLNVPAWGANTVRSEFAFLSGATESMLGVHRFNPYRRVLSGEVITLAHVLKNRGYRTVCIHPYPAAFYGRHKVYPHLGFDEFIDIRSFEEGDRFGPYVADMAVSEKVKSVMGSSDGPLFVFVITMENHGPLHLEKAQPEELDAYYMQPPPTGCDDLTVYLRHLENADRMLGDLRHFLEDFSRPVVFSWFGDHVPIMADVYRQLGDPDGTTQYLIWKNRPTQAQSNRQFVPMNLSDLASALLVVAS